MKKYTLSLSFILSLLAILAFFNHGVFDSSWNERKISSVEKVHYDDYFLDDVKPILDNRCVVCHSCYNAPCQLKLSSYEGIDRGATKKDVYATRVLAAKPTRLFQDAKTTQVWRKQGFYSVKNKGDSDGLMAMMLKLKKDNPHAKGKFKIDSSGYYCPSTKKGFKKYTKHKKWLGMPYGLPALEPENQALLDDWVNLGMPGPSSRADGLLKRISNVNKPQITKWEEFLNQKGLKQRIAARYIYEHLFLAHIHFEGNDGEFFRLVRSKTPSGYVVDEIGTTRPYDDPDVDKFFYRFVKIHSTIVHKTHITYKFSDQRLDRYKELFYTEASWIAEPKKFPVYGKEASNPFMVYKELSPKSRYQFLLDDAHYHVMTFIRGPVCKGQVALNVINDHFHAIFIDPDKDPTVNNLDFLLNNYKDLHLPAKGDNNYFKATLSPYQKGHLSYTKNKVALYQTQAAPKLNLDLVWKGKDKWNSVDNYNDQWLLTIYRHFDSSTVLRGPVGGHPKTTWLLDYPVFERIYYNLVAGFNVYGNLRHQISTRKYMDNLRVESEDNFISLMSQNNRETYRAFINDGALKSLKKRNTYYNKSSKSLTNISASDPIEEKNAILSSLYKDYGKRHHNNRLFSSLEHSEGKYIESLPEVSMILIESDSSKQSQVYTIFKNKFHTNVSFMFKEEKRFVPSKDTLSFIDSVATSYPNIYFKIKENQVEDFQKELAAVTNADQWQEFRSKYGVDRMAPNFWEVHDTVQSYMNKDDKVRAGLLDLNRYRTE